MLLGIIKYINEEKHIPATLDEILHAYDAAFGGSNHLPDASSLSPILEDLCNSGYLEKSSKIEQGSTEVAYTVTNVAEKPSEKEDRIVANTVLALEFSKVTTIGAELANKPGNEKLVLLGIIKYINEEEHKPANLNDIWRALVDAFGGSKNLPDAFSLSHMLEDLCNAGYLEKSSKIEQGSTEVTYTVTNVAEKLNETEARIVTNTIRALEFVSGKRGQ